MSKIHILKFGGTSLQNATFIKQAVQVVRDKTQVARPVIVVSAIAGVTDRLIKLTKIPSSEREEAYELISDLKYLHRELLTQLGGASKESFKTLDLLFEELKAVFFDSQSRNDHKKAWRDHILSIGERASARIFAAALSAQQLPSVTVDSQHTIKTDDAFGEANIIPELTRQLLAKTLKAIDAIAVVTGFIGSTRQQKITTLGRSGSDYTAGIIADALKADQLEIWTDVDGVLTADPKIVPGAKNIEYLSFEDIAELSAHGARVIHPKTVNPIKESDISVLVRNSYDPQKKGTLIQRKHKSNGDFRSITVNGPFVYFEVPDQYVRELSGFIEEKADEESFPEGFSILRSSHFEAAQFVLKESLYKEIEKELKSRFSRKGFKPGVIKNLFRVNTFTNRLKHSDEPVADILRLLKDRRIRPLRVHRDYKSRYFSLLFPEKEAKKSAQLINNYLISDKKRTDIFLAGIGAVGGKLYRLISEFKSDDRALNIIGLCNSKKTIWQNETFHDENLLEKLTNGDPTNWADIVDELTSGGRRRTIFVDATGSEEVARLYPELLEAGLHIATPSKLANTFEQDYYDLVRKKAAGNNAAFRYETNVGAGLPIISTINDLQEIGDSITELSGVVSGTMTYLFNEIENGTSFSKAVVKARELGYAEPDPRDDLSGEDVARKFLTLAREIGLRIERDDVEVESLIPDKLKDVDLDTFMIRLEEHNDFWKEKINQAHSNGETLRYTGKLKGGKIKIGVESLPKNSSLGQLKGTDNLLCIYSDLYDKTPLTIQGAGAGREVTAAGVLNDILKITKEY